MGFSLLSWWDTTYMLQIVLIFHEMKRINTLCLSHLCWYQRLAGNLKASPMGDTFSLKFLLIEHSVRKYCLLWFMPPEFGLSFMKTQLSSLDFDFHVSVDFCFNVSFPHISSVLHPSSIETSRFSLSMHENQLTEEKSMQSSIDTFRLMLPPPVSAQSAFALYKNKNKTKWERLRFMVLNTIELVWVITDSHRIDAPDGTSESML